MAIRGIIYSILTIFFLLIGILVSNTPIEANPNQNPTNLELISHNYGYKSLVNGFVLNNISGENQPKGIFFDPSNHDLYVANYGSKSISVINITANTVMTTIPTEASAWQLTYNSNNKDLYVSNDIANYVTVINTISNTVVANITTGNYGYDVGVFYDRYNHEVYIEADNNNFLIAVNTTTNKVVSVIPIGNGPGNSGVAIDKNNYLYVPDHLSDTINIIDGNNNTVIKTIIVGKAPGATLYDPYNGYIYIAFTGYTFAPGNILGIYDPVHDQIIKYIPVNEFPNMMCYDSLHHAIYELNVLSNSLGIINDTTNTFLGSISVGSSPAGLTLTTNDAYIYVTESGDNNVGYMNVSLAFSLVMENMTLSTQSSLPFPLLSIFLAMLVSIALYKKNDRIKTR